MTVAYEQFADEQDLPRKLRQLAAKTAIFDVEPLVATWDSSTDALDRGIARILEQVAALPELLVVWFATNSARRPSSVPGVPNIQVRYLASAGKPIQTRAYANLPRPGVVVGDQVPTDGILARRLGYTFLHYRAQLSGAPLGPRLMNGCGQLLRPFVFRH
jgi:predicted HAD superfamily phosphohydrolase YqeG